MATPKIDLKRSSGFSIEVENDKITTNDLSYFRSGVVDIATMRSQLLNQELTSPSLFYEKYLKLDHDKILESKGIRFNLYRIKGSLAGIEYCKTRAMRLSKHCKIYEILHGSGIVMFQKIDSKSSDFVLSKVKKDQKVIIPAGYASILINTRSSDFIISEIYSDTLQQSSVLDEMGGMAYYVIRKNAKQEIVRNPKYREAPEIRKVKWDKVLADQNITLRTPVIKQILRKYEKFKWLFEENLSIF